MFFMYSSYIFLYCLIKFIILISLQIIRRLIKHDLLIEYADDEEEKKNEDRLIRISPQFQP